MDYSSVAPLAGAWIEIYYLSQMLSCFQSLPSRERGLKLAENGVIAKVEEVAPLAGAWIEITPGAIHF